MPSTDLAEGMINLGDGIIVESKLRLGAAMFIEKETGVGILKWAEKMADMDSLSFTEIAMFLAALLIQTKPELSKDEALKLISQIEIEKAMEAIAGAFQFEPKNSQGSTDQTETTDPATGS